MPFKFLRPVSAVFNGRGIPMTNNRGTGMFLCGFFAVAALVTLGDPAHAQPLTGTLMGTVSDAQGAVVQGATVRLTSPALIGGPATLTTNDKGQLRFPLLPPGVYALDIERRGLRALSPANILIGVNATVVTTVVLRLAGVAEVGRRRGSAAAHGDARRRGSRTRYRSEELRGIPTRRSSMFDFVRATPGISPTSPSSGTANTVSAFGSGTNENMFLIDGTNFTCPCNGVARSEPVVDFIQEIQVQSVGASAEFGNMQGAVINVVTRQGGDRLARRRRLLRAVSVADEPAGTAARSRRAASWKAATSARDIETSRRTSAVLSSAIACGSSPATSICATTTASRAAIRDSLGPTSRTRSLAKLTWRLPAGLRLVQSVHNESWVSPEQPTLAKPFEATYRRTASSPAVTFGHLTQASSANTVWDVRVGAVRLRAPRRSKQR